MNTVSTTQVSNLTVMAGMLVLLMDKMGIVLSLNDATTIVLFFGMLIASITSYVAKHKKGETTALGFYRR